MAELPAPRDYLASLDGTGFGFTRTEFAPGYNVVHEVNARDLPCDCGALAGEDCRSGRRSKGKKPVPLLCPERLELARRLRDQGQILVAETEAQVRCGKCSFFGGKKYYCDEHKPQKQKSRGRQPKLNPEQRAEVTRRYRAGGTTYNALGREYGVDGETIRKAVREAAAS